MKQFMGDLDGPITIEQLLDMELMNGIIPMALPFLTMIIGARTIAGNEERKTLDLLLSNPLPRRQVVARCGADHGDRDCRSCWRSPGCSPT